MRAFHPRVLSQRRDMWGDGRATFTKPDAGRQATSAEMSIRFGIGSVPVYRQEKGPSADGPSDCQIQRWLACPVYGNENTMMLLPRL